MPVAQCTLLYPGLLGPALPLKELPCDDWPDRAALPGLALLLRRGQAQAMTRQSFEQQLLTRLGYVIPPGAELPVALLREQTARTTSRARLWCLDPVYIQLDREMAYLTSPEALALTESEARKFIASINAHFDGDLHVRYYTPGQWGVEIDLAVSTFTPSQATLQDVNRLQASGADAQRWRKLLNEIQMLLHAHPVNAARLQAGKPPVNSVWLWGGGSLEAGSIDIDVVYADETLAAAAALRNAIAQQALPAMITPDLVVNRDSLLILSQQLDAIQKKDAYAWLAALQKLDQDYVTPLLALLRQGSLTQLTLCSDTLNIRVDRACLGKWWQRPKHMAASLLGLRDHYGY